MTSAFTKTSYKIIPFSPSYQGEVDQLMKEIQLEFAENFSSPGAKSISELTEDGDMFLLALYNDKVIGTIGLSRFNEYTGIIKRMFLHHEHRGREFKIAEQLLKTVVEKAKELGMKEIYLGTMMQFIGAQKFYEKNGFIHRQRSQLPEGMKLSVMDTMFYKLVLDQHK